MNDRNNMFLFWASFLTLIAAGMGFSIRNGILVTWGTQFQFTQAELGDITGFGLVGFGFTIIAFSFVTDRIGYGPLMILAFLLHLSSGIVTLSASPAYAAYGKAGAFWCLSIGGILFSLANGTCEAVINPLTATIFPKEKTHWLNILHAGWPGGLVLGAFLLIMLKNVSWEVKMALFLVPTVIYGLLMIGRKFPTSEAAAAGVDLKTMLLELAAPVLLFLFLLHALVGYVELGVDSWIMNITTVIMDSKDAAFWLFIWTSALMFGLRFFAGPIVHKISPLGLLFACALLAMTGLLMFGMGSRAVWFCFLAGTIYGIGKTFFWPTMLGVVSERYPKGGALTLGIIGGVGMLSAGILGAPGIGYKQVTLEKQTLVSLDPAGYERYRAAEATSFLFFPSIAGLDNSKVAVLLDGGKALNEQVAAFTKEGQPLSENPSLQSLWTWWQEVEKYASQDKEPVAEAQLSRRMALAWTAAVPAMMAVGYLILILYFRAIGGYKAEVLVGHAAEDEKFTGGVEGPAEL